jgi:hypothetical protein
MPLHSLSENRRLFIETIFWSSSDTIASTDLLSDEQDDSIIMNGALKVAYLEVYYKNLAAESQESRAGLPVTWTRIEIGT